MTDRFERVNLILRCDEYNEQLKKVYDFEKNRTFCNHTIEHFLDTARIMYIISLEENLQISKSLIYASALLHDIGRALQYEKNIPHNVASVNIAKKVLSECGFDDFEILQITNAIENHQNALIENEKNENPLAYVLYKADKLSRLCFNCKVEKECYWDNSKKNFDIVY